MPTIPISGHGLSLIHDFILRNSTHPVTGCYLEFLDYGWSLASDEDDFLAAIRGEQQENRVRTTSASTEVNIPACFVGHSGSQRPMDWLRLPVGDLNLDRDLDLDLSFTSDANVDLDDKDGETGGVVVANSGFAPAPENRGLSLVARLTLPFPFPSPWSCGRSLSGTLQPSKPTSPWPFPLPSGSKEDGNGKNSHDCTCPSSSSSSSSSSTVASTRRDKCAPLPTQRRQRPRSAPPSFQQHPSREHACPGRNHSKAAVREIPTSSLNQAPDACFAGEHEGQLNSQDSSPVETVQIPAVYHHQAMPGTTTWHFQQSSDLHSQYHADAYPDVFCSYLQSSYGPGPSCAGYAHPFSHSYYPSGTTGSSPQSCSGYTYPVPNTYGDPHSYQCPSTYQYPYPYQSFGPTSYTGTHPYPHGHPHIGLDTPASYPDLFIYACQSSNFALPFASQLCAASFQPLETQQPWAEATRSMAEEIRWNIRFMRRRLYELQMDIGRKRILYSGLQA